MSQCECLQPNFHTTLQPPALQHSPPIAAFHLNGIHVLYSFTSPRDSARNDRAMTQVPSWVEPFRLHILYQMVSISLKIHPATLISYNIVTSIISSVEEVKVARVPDHQEPSEAVHNQPLPKQPANSHHNQRAMSSTPNHRSTRHRSEANYHTIRKHCQAAAPQRKQRYQPRRRGCKAGCAARDASTEPSGGWWWCPTVARGATRPGRSAPKGERERRRSWAS